MTTDQFELLAQTGTPAGFAQWSSEGRWKVARHLALINQKLVDLAAGRIKRLMVFCPPRHGKSELCSKYFPAWYAGTFPDRRVMLASYEADFAASWGRKARDLLEQFGWVYGVDVSRKSSASDRWDINKHDGGMVTAGVGGPLTGKGANILIIDDPIKNSEDSLSPTIREKQWDWWQSTAFTRIEPGGSALVMLTRWNEDDLAGRILRESEENWEVVCLPAFAHENDPLGRNPGEALWPDRWPAESLTRIQNSIDSYWWAALYDQNPGRGGRAEWPREYFENIIASHAEWPRSFDLRVIAVDPSKGKDGKKGDYSAIVFLGLHNGLLYVDATVRRRTTATIIDDGLEACDRFRPHAFGVEANQYQELLGPEFTRRAQETGRTPPPIYLIQNSVSKELRIGRLGPYMGRRELRFLDTPDNRLLIEQMTTFPHGSHDDGPDALEMAIRLAIETHTTGPSDGLGHNLLGVMR